MGAGRILQKTSISNTNSAGKSACCIRVCTCMGGGRILEKKDIIFYGNIIHIIHVCMTIIVVFYIRTRSIRLLTGGFIQ